MKSYTLSGSRLREVIILTMFGAVMFVSQVCLASLPNIELVSLFIILVARRFGIKSLISVYIFVGCEILTYGISQWVINYLYVWLVLVLAVLSVRRIEGAAVYAVISAIYGLLFGTLCSIPNFFIGGIGYGISYIISGLKFDLLHCAANFAIALLLFKPLTAALNRALG